jgi:hypothetical protein
MLIAACSPPIPTATPTLESIEPSPGPPSVVWWFGRSWVYDGISWTLQGYLDPNGEPTMVVVETGSGTVESPTFTDSITLGDNVDTPGPFDVRVLVRDGGAGFCVRLRATNAHGSDASEVQCAPIAPSG